MDAQETKVNKEKLREALINAIKVNSGVDFLALSLEDQFTNKKAWKKFVNLSHKTARTYHKAIIAIGNELNDFMTDKKTL